MLKLYTAQLCPYAHRARLVLAAKGLPHEREELTLGSFPQWYRELSPNQAVPLLLDGDKKIWESWVIMEYLDEAYPEASLSPADAYGKARQRLLLDLASNKLISKVSPAFRNPDAELPGDDELWSPIEASLDPEGPFWMGSELRLIDLAVYPWFERWSLLERRTGRKLNLPPRLSRWLQALSQHPAVIAEQESPEYYLEAMAARA